MRIVVLRVFILLMCFWMVWGCGEKKVALDKDQFTALLIDMHRIDGTLAVEKIGFNADLKNYAYYNDLFRKYGITRADFDSCMYYYSAQTKLFSGMYDVIIDSLNRQLTGINKVLNELKANDSINYFPVMDTIRLDSIYTVNIDSIVPGLYKFNTTVCFDSAYREGRRLITSYFLSPDEKDTLKVRDIYVSLDTLRRTYNWSQYADSNYSRLVISFLEPVEASKSGFPVRGQKRKQQEKKIRLEDFGGRAWDNQLFRPYVSRSTEERLKESLNRSKGR